MTAAGSAVGENVPQTSSSRKNGSSSNGSGNYDSSGGSSTPEGLAAAAAGNEMAGSNASLARPRGGEGHSSSGSGPVAFNAPAGRENDAVGLLGEDDFRNQRWATKRKDMFHDIDSRRLFGGKREDVLSTIPPRFALAFACGRVRGAGGAKRGQ